MTTVSADDLFYGLFEWRSEAGGRVESRLMVARRFGPSPTIPCPDTGRPLRAATVEVSDRAVWPACA